MKGFLQSLGLNQPQSEAVKKLYTKEPSLRKELLKSLSKIPLPEGILVCDIAKSLGNVFSIICLKYPGATEEDEPLIAANFLTKGVKDSRPLPLVTEDSDLELCSKTFTALCLFLPAMLKRTQRYGSPSPNFYRRTAQSLLKNKSQAHKALADHHRGWETFVYEQFLLGHAS